MKITADFTKITGKIKPMHGVGQPPYSTPLSSPHMHYLGDARIPYARLHDVGGAYGGSRYVDIPNIFPDFDADENDPASYDFAFTDDLIAKIVEQGCGIIYRLGVTIENSFRTKAYRIYPPKDMHKWARICEHVVRHYNEGWADGFHYGIKYWEIWNEPDGSMHFGKCSMWLGTPEQFYSLYEITANHLKKCFGDSIKVGGYASYGFTRSTWKELNEDGTIKDANPEVLGELVPIFFRDFLLHISSEEHKAPLEFFSWHSYWDVKTIEKTEDYVSMMLHKYGFSDVETHLNEWNPGPDRARRGTMYAAAQIWAIMSMMQKRKQVGVMNFYDARMGASVYGGLFNPETCLPYPAYYAFMAFGDAYALGSEVETTSDDEDVYVLGASDGRHSVLLLSNVSTEDREIELNLVGVDMQDAYVLLLDEAHRYSPAGAQAIRDGKLLLHGNACAEIRF